jgi:hypothetical protein
MRPRFLIIGLLLLASTAAAQDGIELFGYFESQIMGAQIKETFNHVQTNKLRIDLKYNPSDNVTFAANYNYITYHGKTEWNVLDFLSDEVTSVIPDIMTDFYVIPFADQNFLDNAYVRLSFSLFDVTAGKQQISLGSGYVWNPTDVFNVKDVLDPTYEKPGHNAVRLDVQLGQSLNLTTLYTPGDTWRASGKLVQLKARVSHFDVSLLAIEKTWLFHDYTRFATTGFGFLELPEKRRVLGANAEGELMGLGLYGEYAYNFMEISGDFQEWVVGLNYTFDFQTYVMLEFYQNTSAKTDYHDYDINDWMRFLATEQKTLSRDQLYALVQHPVTDFIQLGMSGIWSISDKSYALVPTLIWSMFENVDVMAYANVNLGKEGTAYSRLMGNGGLLRARIYF